MAKIDRETVERVLCAAFYNCWAVPYGSKVQAAHVDAVLETVNRSDHRGQHELTKKFERIIPGSGAVDFDPLGLDAGWLNEQDRLRVEALSAGERVHVGSVGFIRRTA